MGDLVPFKNVAHAASAAEQLRARLGELPEWCRAAVATLILHADAASLIAVKRGEALLAAKRAIDACEYPPHEEA